MLILLSAIACAVTIAACGSSRKPSNSTSSGYSSGIKYAECMRSHGEPNFPDPSGSGALDFKLGHINPFSRAYKTAQAACQRVLPIGSSRGAQHPSKQAMGQAVKVSDCMRQHGVTGFPDPTTRMPRHPAAYSSIENNGGVVLAIPGTINTRSSAFKKATAACRLS